MYIKRIAIASLLALAIFGAIYGLAASLSVSGVQKLGSGSSVVSSAPNAQVTSVSWVLLSTNYSKVDKVDVTLGPVSGTTFGEDFSGTMYVDVNPGGSGGKGSATFSYSSSDSSKTVEVDIADFDAASIVKVVITITG
jgi:hypothetical protein